MTSSIFVASSAILSKRDFDALKRVPRRRRRRGNKGDVENEENDDDDDDDDAFPKPKPPL
tara:strand:- start:289 stop:468 length:180 start_codon:yes stop_codon:yes gene_type:complete